MANQWYIYKDRRRQGPFTDADLRQLAGRGALQPASFVWKEGMDSWIRAQRIRGLFASLPAEIQAATPTFPYQDPTDLTVGTPVGRTLRVSELDNAHLTLSARNEVFAVVIAAGIAAIASGVLLFFPQILPQVLRSAPPLAGFALVLVGLMLSLIGLAKLHVTYAIKSDGTVARRQIVAIRWPKGTFSAVYLGVEPGNVTSDVVQMWLWRAAGDHHLQLTWGLGQDPATMRIVSAAGLLSKLLELPIDVDGQAVNSTAELREALARLG